MELGVFCTWVILRSKNFRCNVGDNTNKGVQKFMEINGAECYSVAKAVMLALVKGIVDPWGGPLRSRWRLGVILISTRLERYIITKKISYRVWVFNTISASLQPE